ncbi:MAG: YetF domain-containing protein [Halanaerobiales bacterium]
MQEYFDAIWTTLIVFVLLVTLTRIVGRKLLSQVTFFDFVTGVTIGTIAGAYVVNEVKGNAVLISPIVLVICTLILGYLTVKSLKIRKIVKGEPIVIIQNGKILEKNMLKSRYTLDTLEMQLREKDIFNINEVEFAILEPDGELSVLKKTPYKAVTPKDLEINTNYKGLATEIIKDGEVLERNLKQNNLNFNWLYQELKKQGIEDISKVMLASLNTDGSLYIDLKNETPDYTQKVED